MCFPKIILSAAQQVGRQCQVICGAEFIVQMCEGVFAPSIYEVGYIYFQDAFGPSQPFIKARNCSAYVCVSDLRCVFVSLPPAFALSLSLSPPPQISNVVLGYKEDVNMGVDSYLAHNPSGATTGLRHQVTLLWVLVVARRATLGYMNVISQR